VHSPDICFDTGDCRRCVAIQHECEHSAESHGVGVLTTDKPEHSKLNILDEARARRTAGMVTYIQPLTFQTEVDVFSRYWRREHYVHAPLFLTGSRVEFDELGVDAKWQVASVAGLT